MLGETCANLDPRIRRTRQLLEQALEKLLKKRDLEHISVQDIADAATVNRATFYDHYTDKFALLESIVATRFRELLVERGVNFDCGSALKGMVLAVCDYLTQMPDSQPMESAVISVVRRLMLDGLRQHAPENRANEIVATAASWAIYGAAHEWAKQPDRCPSAEIAESVAELVAPMLQFSRG